MSEILEMVKTIEISIFYEWLNYSSFFLWLEFKKFSCFSNVWFIVRFYQQISGLQLVEAEQAINVANLALYDKSFSWVSGWCTQDAWKDGFDESNLKIEDER